MRELAVRSAPLAFAGLLAAILLEGCAGSPIAISRLDNAGLQDVPLKKLEETCLVLKSHSVMRELERRGVMTADDVENAMEGQVKVGSSEAELICTLPADFVELGRRRTVMTAEGSATYYDTIPWLFHKRVSAVVINGKVSSYTAYDNADSAL